MLKLKKPNISYS